MRLAGMALRLDGSILIIVRTGSDGPETGMKATKPGWECPAINWVSLCLTGRGPETGWEGSDTGRDGHETGLGDTGTGLDGPETC